MRPYWTKVVVAIFIVSTFSLAGCATTPVIRVDQGKPQDYLVDLEQQLREDSHQLQEKLAREGALYDDPALTGYLRELGHKLIPPNLPDGLLEYDFLLIRDPTVNAVSFPNGKTYYHLGLLAHMRTPAMLAAVMAHEISHALHRDMVYLRDDLRQKTIAAKLAQITLVPGAALFGFGDLANLLLNTSYAASVTGYGRDKEARADLYALERLQAAGMNPAAINQVFEIFLKEEERFKQGLEIWFLMSHPTTRQRLADTKKWLEEHGLKMAAPLEDDLGFLKFTDPARIEAANLNIRYGRYFHALDILQDVKSRQPDDPNVLCLEAECYLRLTQDERSAETELSSKSWAEVRPKNEAAWKQTWEEKTKGLLDTVLSQHPNLPNAHRELGLFYAARSEKLLAIQHLESYLALKPDAKDRRFVTSQMEELRQIDESKPAHSRR